MQGINLPKIALVILNWNGLNDTLECLESVKKIDYSNFEMIVVDNGSTDGSPAEIRKQFPNVIVLETGKNLGFAEGNNVGIRHAIANGADYLFLLNNDTVVDSQALNAFLKVSHLYPAAGVFGAKIYYYSEPDRIWFAGGQWNRETLEFIHVGEKKIDNAADYETICESDYACGCAMFVKRAVIEKIGLLEPQFFLTFEETDWSFRAVRAGFQCFFVPKAKVWHKISASFGGETSPLYSYFITRNKLLWARRHLALSGRLPLHLKLYISLIPSFKISKDLNSNFLRRLYWALRKYIEEFRLLLNDTNYRAKLYGIRDYFVGRFGDCPDDVRALLKRKEQVGA